MLCWNVFPKKYLLDYFPKLLCSFRLHWVKSRNKLALNIEFGRKRNALLKERFGEIVKNSALQLKV